MSFQPKEKNKLWIGDYDVYIDDETLPAFYCHPEKPIRFSPEFAEFLEGIPQVLVAKDLTKFGAAVSLTAMEWTPQIIQLSRGGELVTSETDYDYVYFGTTYEEPPEHKFRFVGTRKDGKIIEFVILKGKVEEMPDMTSGGTDYNEIPMVIVALKDETVTNEKRNLAYFRIEK